MVIIIVTTLGSSFQYFIQQRIFFLIPNLISLGLLTLITDRYVEIFLWVIKANFNMVFIIIHAELIFLEMETETAGIIVAFLLLLFK